MTVNSRRVVAGEPGEPSRETEVGSLPVSWKLDRLGDLFDVQQGKALSPSARQGVLPRPFLRTANVLWGRLDLDHLDEMDFTADEAERLSLHPGDLLVCEGGEVGRTAIWRGETEGCSYQNHVHRLRLKQAECVPEFVMYWMQAAFLQLGLYAGAANRTTIPNLSAARLKQLPIPLPPVDEQRSIASILQVLQAAMEVRERIAATLRQLKAATMAKLFREGLRGEPLKQTEIGEIPVDWKVVRLGKIARIGNGSTPKRDNPSYWENGSIPWLTSAKIHESIIESADEFVTDTARAECHLPLVRKDSILVAITGEGKTRGNAALVTFDACVSQHLAYIQLQTNEVFPRFLLFFLQSRYEHLRQVSRAGGSTRAALTCGFLNDYLVPLPSHEEQVQIAGMLGVLAARIGAEEACRQSVGVLFTSMLNLVMAGQVRIRTLADRMGTEGADRDSEHGPPGNIERFVAELVRRFEPERVVLFGSHVPGSPQLRAEVSLLVIMPFEGRSLAEAVRIEQEIEHDFPLEVVVRRPEEVEDAVEKGNPLIEGILKHGRTLYARPGESPVMRRWHEGPREHRPRRTGKVSEDTLREILQRIVAAVAPEKIILFGSAARGEMGPDSDVDLMVVKTCADRRETARTIRRHLWGVAPGLPKDIVVVTPEDVERDRDTIGYIIRPALREGKTVYAA